MKRTPRKKNTDSPSAALSALNFFAEAGLLKRIKRSGWWVAGIEEPESVADHSFRTAIMAYYLALLEAADPFKAMTMALFNDVHEARINDLHKMGHYYIDFKDAERRVFADQIRPLDKRVRESLEKMRREYEAQKSRESLVARDADILECIIQAKEYHHNGHTQAKLFLNKAPAHLKTGSAKKLWRSLKSWDSSRWWQNVVKFER